MNTDDQGVHTGLIISSVLGAMGALATGMLIVAALTFNQLDQTVTVTVAHYAATAAIE